MNKTLFLIVGTFGAAFASEQPVEFKPNDTIETVSQKPIDSVGHFEFKLGPCAISNKLVTPVPVFLVGYQSKIERNQLFDSSRVEIGGGYSGVSGDYDSIWYHPKVSGIKYINPESQQRVYVLTGSHLASVRVETSREEANDRGKIHRRDIFSDRYIGITLGSGLEVGNPMGSTNKLEFTYDLPIMSLERKPLSMNRGIPMITYSVGF